MKARTLSLLLLVACSSDDAPIGESESMARTEPEEWARCWFGERPGPLSSTHEDVFCQANLAAFPGFSDVYAAVDGASVELNGEEQRVHTVRSDRDWSVDLVFRFDAPGIRGSLTRTIDLASTTREAPKRVMSPLTTWTVTVSSNLHDYRTLTLQGYNVEPPGFTTPGHPGLRIGFGLPPVTIENGVETRLIASGTPLKGLVSFFGRPQRPIEIPGPGVYHATYDGLAEGAPVDAGAEPIDPTCGEPGQQCCRQDGGCFCNPYRVRDLYGQCSSCGDRGERACLGGICRPGLTKDAETVCR